MNILTSSVFAGCFVSNQLKQFEKSFYSKTTLHVCFSRIKQKRFEKSFYSKTTLQVVLCLFQPNKTETI